MWLDRLSANPTLSATPVPHQSRSHSPAPRHPGGLAPGAARRPSYGPRNSSLGLNARANVSATSVSSQRLVNGSTLKNQVPPRVDTSDPLRALEAIVGKRLAQDSVKDGIQGDQDVLERPPELLHHVDFQGLSLEGFAENSLEDADEDFERLDTPSTEEYEKEKDKFEDLHRSILACDNVLNSVEVSLTSFQKDLGAVSAEIETLQSRSTALNTRLENRKVVEKLLGPAVEEISIAPQVVKTITEGSIDHNWIKALEDLEKRSKVIDDKMKGSDQILAVTDVKPLLNDLTNKAIERIRDFLVAQIKALRSPNINAQIIQQQQFLRYKDLYTFLSRHHSQLANEIAQAYINTMRWYYLSNFTRYRDALAKLALFIDDKTFALGTDPSTLPRSSQPTHDSLSLGRRIDILHRGNPSALTSYLAAELKSHAYLETPFYNLNLALLSNATAEYTFLASFFSPAHTYHRISSSFNSIFAPTFALGTSFTKTLTESTYDCIGLLLCVRLNQHFAFELQRQKAPVAEGYINGANMLLWPRFQLAMDNHIESIRRATSSVSSSRTLSLTSSQQQSTAPHPLTQRFGLFLSSILQLSPDSAAEESEPVGNSLGRLMGETEAFVAKVGKSLQGGKREKFVTSNWSLVGMVIGEVDGRLAESMRERAEEQKEGGGA